MFILLLFTPLNISCLQGTCIFFWLIFFGFYQYDFFEGKKERKAVTRNDFSEFGFWIFFSEFFRKKCHFRKNVNILIYLSGQILKNKNKVGTTFYESIYRRQIVIFSEFNHKTRLRFILADQDRKIYIYKIPERDTNISSRNFIPMP